MRISVVGLLILSACGNNATKPIDAGPPDAVVDAAPPPYFHPRPGQFRNWDIQTHAPYDVSGLRAMFILNLWDLVPSVMTIDYGDGDPVSVPAGVLAGKLAELHARMPAPVVICRVDTGAWESAAPDARKFPGFKADATMINDNPTPPATGSVIGWSVGGDKQERFLDILPASIPLWEPIMLKRFDLAKAIGCDGIMGDRNDSVTGTITGGQGGFNYPAAMEAFYQGDWYKEVAAQTHTRVMSAGMKDADELPGATDDLVPSFEWLLVQRCAEFASCDGGRPFINQIKAVYGLEYDPDSQGSAANPSTLCTVQLMAMLQDGLIKNDLVSDAERMQCVP